MKTLLVLILMIMLGVQTNVSVLAQSDQQSTNKAIVNTLMDTLYNQGDEEAVQALFADDFVAHNPLKGDLDTDAYLDFVSALRRANPDLVLEPHALLAQDDLVAVAFSMTGTFTHDLPQLALAATQRPWVMNGVAVARMGEGQVTEFWNSFDTLSIAMQWGILPTETLPPVPDKWDVTLSEGEIDPTLVDALLEQVYNEMNPAAIPTFYDANFVMHHPLAGTLDYPGIEAAVHAHRENGESIVFADYMQVAEGNLAVMFDPVTPFGGFAPADFEIPFASLYRFENELVVEEWMSFDTLTFAMSGMN